jgi:hypothetical protein
MASLPGVLRESKVWIKVHPRSGHFTHAAHAPLENSTRECADMQRGFYRPLISFHLPTHDGVVAHPIQWSGRRSGNDPDCTTGFLVKRRKKWIARQVLYGMAD